MKFYYFLTMLTGILILFHLAGVDLPSTQLLQNFGILNSTYSPSAEGVKGSDVIDVSSSPNPSSFYWILIIGTVGGLAVGFLAGGSRIQYVTAPFLAFLFSIALADWVALYSKFIGLGVSWVSGIILSLFGVIIVGFTITALEWWQNAD